MIKSMRVSFAGRVEQKGRNGMHRWLWNLQERASKKK